jgi:hypothetical protein
MEVKLTFIGWTVGHWMYPAPTTSRPDLTRITTRFKPYPGQYNNLMLQPTAACIPRATTVAHPPPVAHHSKHMCHREQSA